MQGAQQRKLHDVTELFSGTKVIQPELVMRMLSPEVSLSKVCMLICWTPSCTAEDGHDHYLETSSSAMEYDAWY